MQGRACNRIAFYLILAIFPLTSPAQSATPDGQAPARAPDFIGQSNPAPDWLVWTAFYKSLERLSEHSVDSAERLVVARLGVSQAKAQELMELGRSYAQTIDRIRSDEKREITDRFYGRALSPDGPSPFAPPTQRRPPTEEELIRARNATPIQTVEGVPSGGSLREVLEKDGTAVRYEAKRMDVLVAHERQLVALLSAPGYEALESWLDADLRDHVRVASGGTRVPISIP